MYDILRRNLGYKVISIVVAFLLWLWVTYSGSVNAVHGEQDINIPLVIRNLPGNMIVMTKLPTVRVRIKSTNPSITVSELYAYVDLSNAQPGEQSYPISMEPILGVEVLEMSPQSVVLNIDTVEEKMVVVELSLQGKPAEGYVTGTPILTPSTVNVRGPSSILATLDKGIVELNIDGAKETVAVTKPVLFRDNAGQPIYGPDPTMETLNASPSSVEVIVPVMAEGLASKTVPVRLSSRGEPAEGMAVRSLAVVPERVQLLGKAEDLQKIDFITLGPIDVSGLESNKVVEISSDSVLLPRGVSFAAKTNFRVIAEIGAAERQRQISGVAVHIRNVPAGLEAQPVEPLVITVKGYPDVLQALTPDQITLWVDAGRLGPGEHPDIEVYYQLPSGVTLVSTPKVTLVLKESEGGDAPQNNHSGSSE